MTNLQQKRQEYSNSLNQLLTISSILAGFSFSGLISLPGLDAQLFEKLASYVRGSFTLGFYYSFYALFFSTLCFLCTIMTVFVYKASNYSVPIGKLRRVYLVANFCFSLAVASLLISVIVFAIPNWGGAILATLLGAGVAGSFIWENMLPWQRRRREQQLQQEAELASN